MSVEQRRRGGPVRRTPPRTIRITLGGPEAILEPAMRGLLTPVLGYAARSYHQGGPRGFEAGLEHHVAARFNPHQAAVPLGFLTRICEVLERHGHAVRIVDDTPPNPRLSTNPELMGRVPAGDRPFVEAIARTYRGQIAVPGERGRIPLLRATALAFPEARILIPTATHDDVRRLHERLSGRLGEPVERCAGFRSRSQARINIATFDPNRVDLDRWDIVFLADGVEATAERPRELLSEVKYQKVFAFVPIGLRLADRERFRLEEVAGTVIYTVPDPRRQAAAVAVHMVPAPAPDVPDDLVGLERKRRAIWHHDRRNDTVAAVAGALADRRVEILREHGLPTRAGDGAAGEDDRAARVAVLVESTEHAAELARRLPGWDVLHEAQQALGGVAGLPTMETRPGPRGTPQGPLPDRSIVTLTRAARFPRLDVDVLVRADGGAWPLDLPGFPPQSAAACDRRVAVVDFLDDLEAARSATRARLRDYEARGWQLEGPELRGNRHRVAVAAPLD